MNVVKKIQLIKRKKNHQISATFYIPDGESIAAVLIVPAIAVSQNYYSNFAVWLSNKGYLVATFDYYGMGQSLTGKLKNIDTNIIDWAENDSAAMVETLSKMTPNKPLYWIGHSLGGQVLGFLPNLSLVTKVITIAAGSGYWLENSPALKKRAWLLWYFAAPLATKICGYFPGKQLHMVGDLPKGVINQWRRWCLHPEYLMGVENEEVRAAFNSVVIPITSISFTDDELMSEKNTDSLHRFYSAAPKTMIRISPQEIGVKRIGHFGFFKEEFENNLWQLKLLPLLET